MRNPFSASVAFAAMLAAEGILAQAMVIPKEPPPPPPRGPVKRIAGLRVSGWFGSLVTTRGIAAGISGYRAGG
jgi:hypothetical protein